MKLSRPVFPGKAGSRTSSSLFLLLLAPWLVSVLAQFAGRAYLLAKHAPPSLYTASSADVGRSLTIGLLFDIKVAAIAFSARCWPASRSPPSPAAARLALAVRAGRGDGMLFTAATVISVFYATPLPVRSTSSCSA